MLLWVAACSMPYQVAATLGGENPGGDVTGTVASGDVGEAAGITNADLAAVGAAASDLFGQEGATTAKWENPLNGARGTVSALASTYRDGGAACNDFLASYVRDGSQAWLQGEACAGGFGRWEVRDIRRWTRS